MSLVLSTSVAAGQTGHITAHNTIHQATNGLIFSTTAFWIPATSVSDQTAGHLMWASARNAASGVAPLDGGSKLPATNLPAVAFRTDTQNNVSGNTLVGLVAFGGLFNSLGVYYGGSGGSSGSPLATTSGTAFVTMYWMGQFSTTPGNLVIGAKMSVVSTETFQGDGGGNATNAGCRVDWYTTPNGTATPQLCMRLEQDQSVTFTDAITCVGINASAVNVTGIFAMVGLGLMTFGAGSNMSMATLTGTKIGTATNQKIGFWGASPVVAPSGWGTPTGTLSRAAYTTSGVNLATLAGFVAAMAVDLLSMGILHA